MKAENLELLIAVLKKAEGFTSAAALSKMVHVDKRTIRNYVNELNRGGKYTIESSAQGYRLVRRPGDGGGRAQEDAQGGRVNAVLYDLLANEAGVSVFELTENLHVSESTVMNDVSFKIKEIVRPYHLEVVSRSYVLSLKGSEQNKRRLIRHLATGNSGHFFLSNAVLRQLSADLNLEEIHDVILRFCREANLSLNSYALNNLIAHIIVIFIRLRSNNALPGTERIYNTDRILLNSAQKEDILSFARKIREYGQVVCGRDLERNDFEQIVLLILLSVEPFWNEEMDWERFTEYVDRDFFNRVVELVAQVNRRYHLPDMDQGSLCQFTLHIFNLYQRCVYRIRYPNPIGAQIKKDYAPIYDIAVYFAHQLSQAFHIEISEDEIGFIAFHFGAHLEKNHAADSQRIPCLLVVENYHSFVRAFVHELHIEFAKELHIVDMIPFADYRPERSEGAALIVSTTDYDFGHPHTVVVNPILTRKNLRAIQDEIDKLRREKRYEPVLAFLRYMFSERLYFRNVYPGSVEDTIRFMGEACRREGYADEAFIQDVLNRESFSSTAFTDVLAIPHSISVNAKRSFICVLHNDKPVAWHKKNVHFVLLTGIAQEDMKYFTDVMYMIVEAFSSVEHTLRLLKTDSLQTFVEVLAGQ